MTTTTRIYCVRCGEQVGGPARGTLGLTGHTGHLDRALDRTCGTWGYRAERASDRDEEEG